jgi:hypothetical protein
MMNLSSREFCAAVFQEFDFLLASGFRVPSDGIEDTNLLASVVYGGTHVSVRCALDRREDWIDCYVRPVGRLEVRPLHGFLVKYRGYRGDLGEFDPEDASLPAHVRVLRKYATALQALAPDVAADSADVFVLQPRRLFQR